MNGSVSLDIPGKMSMPELFMGGELYCGDTGPQQPKLHIVVSVAEGEAIKFIDGVELSSFNMDVLAFENISNGASSWMFAGEVSGKLAIAAKGGGDVGAEVFFMFDMRDGSWAAAIVITYETDDLKLKLRAGTATKCTKSHNLDAWRRYIEAGSYLGGDLSVKFPGTAKDEDGKAVDNFITARAAGQLNCGMYAIRNGIYHVKLVVDEGFIQYEKVAVQLKIVSLEVTAFVPKKTVPSQVAALAEQPEKLDWNVTVQARAFFKFSEDVSSMDLNAVMGGGTFNATLTIPAGGAPVLNNIHIRAIMNYKEPALPGSFAEKKDMKNKVYVQGDAEVKYPCVGGIEGEKFVHTEVDFDLVDQGIVIKGAFAEFDMYCPDDTQEKNDMFTIGGMVPSMTCGAEDAEPFIVKDVKFNVTAFTMKKGGETKYRGNFKGTIQMPEEEGSVEAKGNLFFDTSTVPATFSVSASIHWKQPGLEILLEGSYSNDEECKRGSVISFFGGMWIAPTKGSSEINMALSAKYVCPVKDTVSGKWVFAALAEQGNSLDGMSGLSLNVDQLRADIEVECAMDFSDVTRVSGVVSGNWSAHAMGDLSDMPVPMGSIKGHAVVKFGGPPDQIFETAVWHFDTRAEIIYTDGKKNGMLAELKGRIMFGIPCVEASITDADFKFRFGEGYYFDGFEHLSATFRCGATPLEQETDLEVIRIATVVAVKQAPFRMGKMTLKGIEIEIFFDENVDAKAKAIADGYDPTDWGDASQWLDFRGRFTGAVEIGDGDDSGAFTIGAGVSAAFAVEHAVGLTEWDLNATTVASFDTSGDWGMMSMRGELALEGTASLNVGESPLVFMATAIYNRGDLSVKASSADWSMSEELTITGMFFEFNGTLPKDGNFETLAGSGIFGGGVALGFPMAGLDLSLSASCPFVLTGNKDAALQVTCDILGTASLELGPVESPWLILHGSTEFRLPCEPNGTIVVQGSADLTVEDAGISMETTNAGIRVPCNADAPIWKAPGAKVAEFWITETDVMSPLLRIDNANITGTFFNKPGGYGGTDVVLTAEASEPDDKATDGITLWGSARVDTRNGSSYLDGVMVIEAPGLMSLRGEGEFNLVSKGCSSLNLKLTADIPLGDIGTARAAGSVHTTCGEGHQPGIVIAAELSADLSVAAGIKVKKARVDLNGTVVDAAFVGMSIIQAYEAASGGKSPTMHFSGTFVGIAELDTTSTNTAVPTLTGMSASAAVFFDFFTEPGVVDVPVVHVAANFSMKTEGVALSGKATFPIPCDAGKKVVLSGGMLLDFGDTPDGDLTSISFGGIWFCGPPAVAGAPVLRVTASVSSLPSLAGFNLVKGTITLNAFARAPGTVLSTVAQLGDLSDLYYVGWIRGTVQLETKPEGNDVSDFARATADVFLRFDTKTNPIKVAVSATIAVEVGGWLNGTIALDAAGGGSSSSSECPVSTARTSGDFVINVQEPFIMKAKASVSGELDCESDEPLRVTARIPSVVIALQGTTLTLTDFYAEVTASRAAPSRMASASAQPAADTSAVAEFGASGAMDWERLHWRLSANGRVKGDLLQMKGITLDPLGAAIDVNISVSPSSIAGQDPVVKLDGIKVSTGYTITVGIVESPIALVKGTVTATFPVKNGMTVKTKGSIAFLGRSEMAAVGNVKYAGILRLGKDVGSSGLPEMEFNISVHRLTLGKLEISNFEASLSIFRNQNPTSDERYVSGSLSGTFALGDAIGAEVNLVYQGMPGSEWIEAAVSFELNLPGFYVKLTGKISTNGCSQDDMYTGLMRIKPSPDSGEIVATAIASKSCESDSFLVKGNSPRWDIRVGVDAADLFGDNIKLAQVKIHAMGFPTEHKNALTGSDMSAAPVGADDGEQGFADLKWTGYIEGAVAFDAGANDETSISFGGKLTWIMDSGEFTVDNIHVNASLRVGFDENRAQFRGTAAIDIEPSNAGKEMTFDFVGTAVLQMKKAYGDIDAYLGAKITVHHSRSRGTRIKLTNYTEAYDPMGALGDHETHRQYSPAALMGRGTFHHLPPPAQRAIIDHAPHVAEDLRRGLMVRERREHKEKCAVPGTRKFTLNVGCIPESVVKKRVFPVASATVGSGALIATGVALVMYDDEGNRIGEHVDMFKKSYSQFEVCLKPDTVAAAATSFGFELRGGNEWSVVDAPLGIADDAKRESFESCISSSTGGRRLSGLDEKFVWGTCHATCDSRLGGPEMMHQRMILFPGENHTMDGRIAREADLGDKVKKAVERSGFIKNSWFEVWDIAYDAELVIQDGKWQASLDISGRARMEFPGDVPVIFSIPHSSLSFRSSPFYFATEFSGSAQFGDFMTLTASISSEITEHKVKLAAAGSLLINFDDVNIDISARGAIAFGIGHYAKETPFELFLELNAHEISLGRYLPKVVDLKAMLDVRVETGGHWRVSTEFSGRVVMDNFLTWINELSEDGGGPDLGTLSGELTFNASTTSQPGSILKFNNLMFDLTIQYVTMDGAIQIDGYAFFQMPCMIGKSISVGLKMTLSFGSINTYASVDLSLFCLKPGSVVDHDAIVQIATFSVNFNGDFELEGVKLAGGMQMIGGLSKRGEKGKAFVTGSFSASVEIEASSNSFSSSSVITLNTDPKADEAFSVETTSELELFDGLIYVKLHGKLAFKDAGVCGALQGTGRLSFDPKKQLEALDPALANNNVLEMDSKYEWSLIGSVSKFCTGDKVYDIKASGSFLSESGFLAGLGPKEDGSRGAMAGVKGIGMMSIDLHAVGTLCNPSLSGVMSKKPCTGTDRSPDAVDWWIEGKVTGDIGAQLSYFDSGFGLESTIMFGFEFGFELVKKPSEDVLKFHFVLQGSAEWIPLSALFEDGTENQMLRLKILGRVEFPSQESKVMVAAEVAINVPFKEPDGTNHGGIEFEASCKIILSFYWGKDAGQKVADERRQRAPMLEVYGAMSASFEIKVLFGIKLKGLKFAFQYMYQPHDKPVMVGTIECTLELTVAEGLSISTNGIIYAETTILADIEEAIEAIATKGESVPGQMLETLQREAMGKIMDMIEEGESMIDKALEDAMNVDKASAALGTDEHLFDGALRRAGLARSDVEVPEFDSSREKEARLGFVMKGKNPYGDILAPPIDVYFIFKINVGAGEMLDAAGYPGGTEDANVVVKGAMTGRFPSFDTEDKWMFTGTLKAELKGSESFVPGIEAEGKVKAKIKFGIDMLSVNLPVAGGQFSMPLPRMDFMFVVAFENKGDPIQLKFTEDWGTPPLPDTFNFEILCNANKGHVRLSVAYDELFYIGASLNFDFDYNFALSGEVFADAHDVSIERVASEILGFSPTKIFDDLFEFVDDVYNFVMYPKTSVLDVVFGGEGLDDAFQTMSREDIKQERKERRARIKDIWDKLGKGDWSWIFNFEDGAPPPDPEVPDPIGDMMKEATDFIYLTIRNLIKLAVSRFITTTCEFFGVAISMKVDLLPGTLTAAAGLSLKKCNLFFPLPPISAAGLIIMDPFLSLAVWFDGINLNIDWDEFFVELAKQKDILVKDIGLSKEEEEEEGWKAIQAIAKTIQALLFVDELKFAFATKETAMPLGMNRLEGIPDIPRINPGMSFDLVINDPYEKFQQAEMSWASMDNPSGAVEIPVEEDWGKDLMKNTLGKLEKLEMSMVLIIDIWPYKEPRFGLSMEYYMKTKTPIETFIPGVSVVYEKLSGYLGYDGVDFKLNLKLNKGHELAIMNIETFTKTFMLPNPVPDREDNQLFGWNEIIKGGKSTQTLQWDFEGTISISMMENSGKMGMMNKLSRPDGGKYWLNPFGLLDNIAFELPTASEFSFDFWKCLFPGLIIEIMSVMFAMAEWAIVAALRIAFKAATAGAILVAQMTSLALSITVTAISIVTLVASWGTTAPVTAVTTIMGIVGSIGSIIMSIISLIDALFTLMWEIGTQIVNLIVEVFFGFIEKFWILITGCVPTPVMFSAGIQMCSTPIEKKEVAPKASTAKLGGIGGLFGGGGEEPWEVQCSEDDLYGRKPMSARILFLFEFGIAFKMVFKFEMEAISLSRLVSVMMATGANVLDSIMDTMLAFVGLPMDERPSLGQFAHLEDDWLRQVVSDIREFFGMLREFVDLVLFLFDTIQIGKVSIVTNLNIMPVTIENTDEEIPPGLTVDLQNMRIFGIVIARLGFSLNVFPPNLKINAFMQTIRSEGGPDDWFPFHIGGVTKTRGPIMERMAAVKANKAERMAKQFGGGAAEKLEDSGCGAVGTEDPNGCMSCGEISGGGELTLVCTRGKYIAKVHDALWQTTEGKASWSFTESPMRCEATSVPRSSSVKMAMPSAHTMDIVSALCVGKKACALSARTLIFGEACPASLGTPAGHHAAMGAASECAGNADMTLSAMVECLPKKNIDFKKARADEKKYLSVRDCRDGCYTCAESYNGTFALECNADEIIVAVKAGSFGATANTHPWPEASATPGLCFASRIPENNVKHAPGKDVVRLLERLCLGMPLCRLSTSAFVAALGGDPAPGQRKKIRAVVRCRKKDVPDAVNEIPEYNSFAYLHYAVRKTRVYKPAHTVFSMRAMFENIPGNTTYHISNLTSLTKLPLGAASLESSRLSKGATETWEVTGGKSTA